MCSISDTLRVTIPILRYCELIVACFLGWASRYSWCPSLERECILPSYPGSTFFVYFLNISQEVVLLIEKITSCRPFSWLALLLRLGSRSSPTPHSFMYLVFEIFRKFDIAWVQKLYLFPLYELVLLRFLSLSGTRYTPRLVVWVIFKTQFSDLDGLKW